MAVPVTTQGRVLVVGAGPVGLVCALALQRKGVPVTVLEAAPGLVRDQRAGSNQPSTLEMLEGLGLIQEILPRGLIAPLYHIRDRLSGAVIAAFDLTLLKDRVRYPFVLQYEQYKLTADLYRKFISESGSTVLFSTRVTSVAQTDDAVVVTAEGPDGPERFTAAYLVGADGGRSTVRKSLGIAFEGFTYPERFIKIATTFDFSAGYPDLALRSYFSDPEEWCNLFKVRAETPDGVWRTVMPMRVEEKEADALSPAGLERRLQRLFSKATPYEIIDRDIYTVHQRVAATFHLHRVVLAGDAAHVNNPIGGLGLNSGIHDAVNLAGKLARVVHREAGEELLALYSRQRRKAAVDYVQEQTIRNKKLLDERDPVIRQRNFDALRRIAEDPVQAADMMYRAALFPSLAAANAVN